MTYTEEQGGSNPSLTHLTPVSAQKARVLRLQLTFLQIWVLITAVKWSFFRLSVQLHNLWILQNTLSRILYAMDKHISNEKNCTNKHITQELVCENWWAGFG